MNKAWRATLYLSAYFFGFGIQLPYFPKWLEVARDLTGTELSIVLYGALLGRIVTGPILAAWADDKSARTATVTLNLSALAFLLLVGQIHHVLSLMLAGFVALTIVYAIAPVAEAILLRASIEEKKPPYTTGRAIASTAFVVGVLFGGKILDVWGGESLLPAILIFYAISSGIAFLLPNDPMGSFEGGGFFARLKKAKIIFQRPALFFLLIASGLVQSSHSFYYGFSTIIWGEQNFSGGLISFFWIIGVLPEIVLFFVASKLPTWVTPQRLLLVGALAAVVRWGGLGFGPTDFSTIVVLQLLHALTFAASYLGTIRVIERDVDADDRASVLSVFAAITTGVFAGTMGILSGRLYDDFNEKAYWLMALASIVGVIFAILLMIRVATRPSRK